LFQLRKVGRVGLKFRQCVSQVKRDHSFKTSPCRNKVLPGVIHRGKESEHCGFGWFVAELDVMFRGIVETALGFDEVALVEKALAELAIGHRESFFIPDDSMMVEGLLERRDGLLPLPFASLLQRQIVMENAERAIVFQCAEEIQCFKVVGAGFPRMVGADVKIAEIHQRVGDGVLIPLRALDREYFPIAGFCVTQVAREGADVAKIAERIGESAVVIGQAIIPDCLFIGRFGLRELAAVEKNARAMFVVISHALSLVSDHRSVSDNP
jgi:hypothetical protein